MPPRWRAWTSTAPTPPPDPDLLGISNLWLNYAYKLGPMGLALFLWLSWRWWRTVRTRVRGDAWREDPLALGVVAALLVAYATGLFDHYYSFTPVLTGLFWFLTGLSLTLVSTRPSNSEKEE